MMDCKRHMLWSWMIAVTLIVSLISGVVSVYASSVTGTGNDDVKIEAVREGDILQIALVANRDLTFGGLGFDYSFDNKTSYISYSPNTEIFDGAKQINTDPAVQRVGLSSNVKTAGPETSLVSFSYGITDGFIPDTDYTFTMTMVSVFDDNYNRFSWGKDPFAVTYRENTVSFNLNYETEERIENQYVVNGGKAEKPEDPTREGYTFKGWQRDGAAYDFESEINNERIDLTAQWEADKHSVSYSLTEGSDSPEGYQVPDAADVEFGTEKVAVAETPDAAQYTEKEGIPGTWSFEGWTAPEGVTVENGSFTMPNSDVTFTGTWTFTPDKYDVYYHVSENRPSDYKEPIGPKDVEVGRALDMPDDLKTEDTAKNGIPGTWTFSGWTITEPEGLTVSEGKYTMPASDVSISGSWTFTPAEYTVTYTDGVDEEEIFADQTYTKQYGDATPAFGGEPNREGYTFTGWTPEVAETVTGNAAYTATWEKNAVTYTITWVNYDDKQLAQTTVNEGDTPSYNGAVPTKPEDEDNTYTFAGWTPELVPASGNATYKAVFKANAKDKYNLVDPVLPTPTETPAPPEKVTITWLNYDGTPIEKTTVAYGKTPSHADPELAPSAEGKTYTFKGWSPAITEATTDAVYTAQFTEKDNETEAETDLPVPTPPETPEDTDKDPTNHEELPAITTKDHTYEIYQIFSGDYTELDGKDVLTNIVWGANGKDPKNAEAAVGSSVDKTILDALTAVVNEELDRTKLDEIEKYVKIDGKPYETITLKKGDQENSIQLPPGYYLIRDVAGSHSGDKQDHDAYTTYITVVIKDYTIRPKSVIPTVDKQVWDNNDGSNEEGWAETADHNINESFKFALIGTIPRNEHLKDYTNGYIVKFTDTMSAGVTFESIDQVTVNGTEVSAEKYTVEGVEAGDAGKTWTLQMDVRDILGADSFGTGTSDISVVVTYNAHLNGDAITHKESDAGTAEKNTNCNTVFLEYSNNPNTGGQGDMGRTQEDHVWVFTYEVDNIKKADSAEGAPLAGAGFELLKDGSAVKLIKNGTNYIVADQKATEGVITEMITDETGVFNIRGLDAGTYILHEKTTPPGYNTVEDTTVTISASHEEAPAGTSAKLNLTGTNTDNTIINQSGSQLPSTGGMGTWLFYMLGTMLVLGAGVLLVSRRMV